MLIETQDLHKVYPLGRTEVHALRGVSLQVTEGEFVALIGPSGSGKSTLLYLLGCLDRPSRGRYWLAGVPVEALGDRDLSRLRNRKIGFIFQAFNLIPQHTVVENVELPLVYAGVSRPVRRDKSLRLLAQVGLADRAHHRPTEISGGEAQRVAIARALAIDPLLLLADEPSGNLDSRTGDEIMKLFVELNRGGTAILMVTHNPAIAAHAARVIEMKDGIVIGDSAGRIVTPRAV